MEEDSLEYVEKALKLLCEDAIPTDHITATTKTSTEIDLIRANKGFIIVPGVNVNTKLGTINAEQKTLSDHLLKKISEYRKKHDTELKDSCKVVVFSEFFFKKINDSGIKPTALDAKFNCKFDNKLDPLKSHECKDCLQRILNISEKCKKTIFFPHFLYYRSYSKPADNALLERHNDIFHNKHRINSTYDLHRPPIAGDPKSVVMNISCSIWDKRILTEYNKSSYCKEADEFLRYEIIAGTPVIINKEGGIYYFGNASDAVAKLLKADTAVITDADNVTSDSLRDSLLRNISSEICFDLCNGVRHSNGWCSNSCQSNILILQSNVIDSTGRTYANENINHLPRNRLILHADASKDPPSGSHLLEINETGAPVIYKEDNPEEWLYDEISIYPKSVSDFWFILNGIKICIYKIN